MFAVFDHPFFYFTADKNLKVQLRKLNCDGGRWNLKSGCLFM